MPKANEVINLLLKDGLITQENVNQAKEEAQKTGLSLERALEKLGFIKDKDIVRVRAAALGLPYMDLTDYIIDTELIKLIPEDIAKKFKAVPLFKIRNSLTVGMLDPQDIMALDQIRKSTKMEMIEPVLVTEKGIQAVLNNYYRSTDTINEIVESIDHEKIDEAEKRGHAQAAEEAPVVRLVNTVISQAIKERASDIHVEPEEDLVRVRSRIDGVLHELTSIPKKLQNAVISRIKVLAKMDISENRKPQDGRIRIQFDNKNLDLRVSTFPTVHGENVVMRLLDKSSVVFGLKELGFMGSDLQAFSKLIHRSNGIVLVTGPTGSGKTTTLYSALMTISTMEKNIITIEDPVEYELPLIRQTQVNPKAGITFANGLRNIVRQDPDIIMVGEIRDKETADVAIQSALTGHLVFSTLHTNDAPSTLTRLIDMGVEPFLVSSSVIGIVAQRLVRINCQKCKEKYKESPDVLTDLGITENIETFRGKGCNRCKNTGFAGRLGIFEIIVMNEEMKKLVDAKASSDDIKKKAIEVGLRTLREDGIEKVKQGLTTAEELLRVTQLDY